MIRSTSFRLISNNKSDPKCFLCGIKSDNKCCHCQKIYYCSDEHLKLHRIENINYCFPYETSFKDGVGRILRATRTIKPMELVLVDPGTVVGPNYSSVPVCLECLKPIDGKILCPSCKYPICSDKCLQIRKFHTKEECKILSRCKQWPPALRFRDYVNESNAYAVITPLRFLLMQSQNEDRWKRTDQLMDHLEDRKVNLDEWNWYQTQIVDFFRSDLGLSHFSEEEIHRAIGILNINAVTLQFPKQNTSKHEAIGKGLYPIFAIMSHYCICNARYTINPNTFEMYVRARRLIVEGEEISVQYLSALQGNFKRRKKIWNDWYFHCQCRRCSDPTECGTNISAIKCFQCFTGNVLPLDSLDYESVWKCNSCHYESLPEDIEILVDKIEEELDDIGKSGKFHKYDDFINNYKDTLLHSNHYLLMIATRNLIQYYTYGISNESLTPEILRKKLQLCQHFYNVLTKVDPGYSEIRSFVAKELNFCKLIIYQRELHSGDLSREDYLSKSRQALQALDDVERTKRLLIFSSS